MQGYSSEEEVQERYSDSDSEGTDDEDVAVLVRAESRTGPDLSPDESEGSSLPSATHIFSEVTGPPEYLKNSVVSITGSRPRPRNFSHKHHHRSQMVQGSPAPKEPPAGAVVEAKPQLVGMYDRVRSDKDNIKDEPRKLPSAGLPPAEDAAKLLMMCLQCGIPKTYSAAKEGMLCPVCKDRPAVDTDELGKKRGSAIKDKERMKRMKGQSSHATWKSETEMQLRQQFD